ncbi:hypothetical protein [Robiginitomaculum antarcticum]|uniref:hypothetical protein n=1 Tax=Robiginitomaculum antarcticum TaxID=437507 RepID=UPI000376445B|nr:hypothetical protein [Robiginitomaculum antarcticum]
MVFLNFLATMFLLPGTIVLKMVGVSVDDDGGIFRSLINMIFWGILSAMIVLPILLK